MIKFLKHFFSVVFESDDSRIRREQEAYLAEATSHADLDARMRNLDRSNRSTTLRANF